MSRTVRQRVLDPNSFFFGGFPREQLSKQQGFGSGFIISQDGYILTNNHVVSLENTGPVDTILVRLPDRREFEGKVVGTDPPTDVALVKIDAKDLPVSPLGSSEGLEVGEWVIAIGSPYQLDATVTSGIISATGRARVGVSTYEDFIQTDAAINPGNSGGPLINLKGEVIGINSAIYGGMAKANLGIGFAIPIDMAKFVANELKTKGRVIRGYIGANLDDISGELAEQLDLKEGAGALVTRVTNGDPAARAGIRRSDVILAFDGKPVTDSQRLLFLVAETPPGRKVKLEILRGKERKEVLLEVGARPDDRSLASREEAPDPASDTPALAKLGISGRDLSDALARRLSIDPDEGGIEVVTVKPRSPAARADIQDGDILLAVGRTPVGSTAYLEQILSGIRSGRKVALLVVRGTESFYRTVTIP